MPRLPNCGAFDHLVRTDVPMGRMLGMCALDGRSNRATDDGAAHATTDGDASTAAEVEAAAGAVDAAARAAVEVEAGNAERASSGMRMVAGEAPTGTTSCGAISLSSCRTAPAADDDPDVSTAGEAASCTARVTAAAISSSLSSSLLFRSKRNIAARRGRKEERVST